MNDTRTLRRFFVATAAVGAAHAAAMYLFRRRRARYAGRRRHVLVTQGGTHLRSSASEMDDAVISILMGGALVEVDGRVSQDVRPMRLDVMVVMGGLQVLVPPDWNVRVEADVTMGGIRDWRSGAVDTQRPADLVITGTVLMGGLDVLDELPHGGSPSLGYGLPKQ